MKFKVIDKRTGEEVNRFAMLSNMGDIYFFDEDGDMYDAEGCCEAIPVPDTVEQDYDDEKGTGGLWDLAAEIALAVAAERGAETPCYAEERGQERIYGLLKAREQENG